MLLQLIEIDLIKSEVHSLVLTLKDKDQRHTVGRLYKVCDFTVNFKELIQLQKYCFVTAFGNRITLLELILEIYSVAGEFYMAFRADCLVQVFSRMRSKSAGNPST